MKKPVLVIMAAGMGSRYGGLKQIDSIDEHGFKIIDYSIYDAVQAGFEKVIMIIKHEIEQEFKEQIGDRIAKKVQVEYVYQELDKLPVGFTVPKERKKPWGTGHALLCCKDVIDGPFAVINADDFYGRTAYEKMFAFLQGKEAVKKHYAMAGYGLYQTLTENGHVARGICTVDAEGKLKAITERTRIEKHGEIAEYTEDEGKTWNPLAKDTIVSMNLWGFTREILDELEYSFVSFLNLEADANPCKSEFFLPSVVNRMIQSKEAQVTVLKSDDPWYGVTYKEDKEVIVRAVQKMRSEGKYPGCLWEEEG